MLIARNEYLFQDKARTRVVKVYLRRQALGYHNKEIDANKVVSWYQWYVEADQKIIHRWARFVRP